MPANKPPFDGEWVRLKGRVEYVRGVTYKAAVDLHEELDRGSYILLRANNIQDGRLSFDDVQYVDKSRFNLLKAYGSIIALFRVLFP